MQYTTDKKMDAYLNFDENADVQEVEQMDVPRRRVRDRTNPYTYFRDDEFQLRYRFRKDTAMDLTEMVREAISRPTLRNACVPAELQVLTFLRFLATGCFLVTDGDLTGIHKSTASRIIHRVASAFAAKRPDYVTFPDEARVNRVKQDFYEIAGFPGVIGCIDCSHIRIMRPSVEDAELYRNRKGYYSINVQAVCDANLRISSLVARWPGSTHDARILNNSVLSVRLENRDINGHLLGDNGYPNRPYLLTPVLNPQNRGEERYNASHIATRNTIERLFGVLKRRFPVLHYGIRFNPQRSSTVIIAACVLYNYAVDLHDIGALDDFIPDVIPVADRLGNGANAERQALIQTHFT